MEKRVVPKKIQQILKFDDYITKRFTTWANGISFLKTLRIHYKGLEISCHGIPWFAFWISFTWLFNTKNLIQMQFNMLLGLFLDIVLVAIAKAYFRRKRPQSNKDDALGQIGPDVYSFPSGHASRAIFVVFFFLYLWPVHVIFYSPLLTWATSVCISRILMNRHYILDVIAGCVLGILEGLLMCLLWLDESTAKSLFSMLSNEKVSGDD